MVVVDLQGLFILMQHAVPLAEVQPVDTVSRKLCYEFGESFSDELFGLFQIDPFV
jgi:hypothetical protein